MKRNRYKSLKLGDKKQLGVKVLFTFFMILIYKLLSFVPAPFINRNVLYDLVSDISILQTAQLFSGRAITQLTLMATGVSSYITASIILQFVTYANKRLDEISKSSNGEKIMKRLTMILGVILSIITSLVFTIGLSSQESNILTNNSWYAFATIALVHAAGTVIAILIGEAIEKKGYGNGVSLLIAVNVVSSLPMIGNSLIVASMGVKIVAIIATIVMSFLIIMVDSSEKKIPVLYSKVVARTTGNMRSSRQTIPLKVNATGVMPIILASFIFQILATIVTVTGNEKAMNVLTLIMDPKKLYHGIITSILIVLFTFVYAKVIFNAGDVAENLQKNGGALIGVRPGRDTRIYLQKISDKLTRISAVYLLVVSLIPVLMTAFLDFSGLQATSLMILIGVSLDTIIKLGNEYSLGKMKL